jgi:mannitol/fructose-specific phosphotransferase system IIA component (Ntr-type)
MGGGVAIPHARLHEIQKPFAVLVRLKEPIDFGASTEVLFLCTRSQCDHIKAALKMQINKSDRNDAAGIARIMQCGWYKEVRVKDLESHAVKALSGQAELFSSRSSEILDAFG